MKQCIKLSFNEIASEILSLLQRQGKIPKQIKNPTAVWDWTRDSTNTSTLTIEWEE